MKAVDISVIVPTYNEKGNIIPLITAIMRELRTTHKTFEIIVVDDSSPDRTGDLVKQTYRNTEPVRCIIRHSDPGLGASILTGIRQVHGSVIIGMDADFNHDPLLLSSMIRSLSNADLVVASRFIRGGGMKDVWRYLTSYAFNLVLHYCFGFPIWDNTSGYYAIRRSSLECLNPNAIYKGYGEYHLILVYRAFQRGLRITEVPVYYSARRYGQSKSKFFTMVVSYIRTARELSR